MKPINKFYIKSSWGNSVGGLSHIKERDRIEVDNIPLAGFRFDGFSITDPRGFTVDLSPSNIRLIVNNCIIKNGIILNKMYYFLENNRSIRLDIYNEMVEKVVQKKITELDIGDVLHDGTVYIGKARVIEYQTSFCLYSNRTFKHGIKHCFLTKEEVDGKESITLKAVANSVMDYAVVDKTDEYNNTEDIFVKENALEDNEVKIKNLYFPVDSKIISEKSKIKSQKEWNEEINKVENVLYNKELEIRFVPRKMFHINPWDRSTRPYISYVGGSKTNKDFIYTKDKSFIEKTYIVFQDNKFRLI